MTLFRADERSEKDNREVFDAMNKAFDTLHAAGMEATPKRVEDTLNAWGIPVTVFEGNDGVFNVWKITSN